MRSLIINSEDDSQGLYFVFLVDRVINNKSIHIKFSESVTLGCCYPVPDQKLLKSLGSK